MKLGTFFAGWLTFGALKKIAPVLFIVFLLYQCNRGCGTTATSQLFDYKTIAVSLPKTDTIEVDTIAATEDIKKIMAEEMIQFTKHYDELFVSYLRKKYKFTNGYIEKIDSSENK